VEHDGVGWVEPGFTWAIALDFAPAIGSSAKLNWKTASCLSQKTAFQADMSLGTRAAGILFLSSSIEERIKGEESIPLANRIKAANLFSDFLWRAAQNR
jgi:hypothetical protein